MDTYEVHFYAPTKEELEDEVRKEGSFKIEVIEKFEIDKDAGNCSSYGMAVAKTVRSIQEPMIAHHFGQEILDKLFELYGILVDREMAKEDIRSITIVLVLTKLWEEDERIGQIEASQFDYIRGGVVNLSKNLCYLPLVKNK